MHRIYARYRQLVGEAPSFTMADMFMAVMFDEKLRASYLQTSHTNGLLDFCFDNLDDVLSSMYVQCMSQTGYAKAGAYRGMNSELKESVIKELESYNRSIFTGILTGEMDYETKRHFTRQSDELYAVLGVDPSDSSERQAATNHPSSEAIERLVHDEVESQIDRMGNKYGGSRPIPMEAVEQVVQYYSLTFPGSDTCTTADAMVALLRVARSSDPRDFGSTPEELMMGVQLKMTQILMNLQEWVTRDKGTAENLAKRVEVRGTNSYVYAQDITDFSEEKLLAVLGEDIYKQVDGPIEEMWDPRQECIHAALEIIINVWRFNVTDKLPDVVYASVCGWALNSYELGTNIYYYNKVREFLMSFGTPEQVETAILDAWDLHDKYDAVHALIVNNYSEGEDILYNRTGDIVPSLGKVFEQFRHDYISHATNGKMTRSEALVKFPLGSRSLAAWVAHVVSSVAES